jgi:hypothetical protein
VTEEIPTSELVGVGCAWIAFALNLGIIGLFAFSFSQGPYSSSEQELWYRYGSLGFFVAGAILPAIVLARSRRRSTHATVALIAWMVAVLVAFIIYAALSGGGV